MLFIDQSRLNLTINVFSFPEVKGRNKLQLRNMRKEFLGLIIGDLKAVLNTPTSFNGIEMAHKQNKE